nr:MAG TPA: hypothetical protein [Bacteriophage sp.]
MIRWVRSPNMQIYLVLCSNIIFFRQFVAGNEQHHKSDYVT